MERYEDGLELDSILKHISKKEVYWYFRHYFFNKRIIIDDRLATKKQLEEIHLYLFSIIIGFNLKNENQISSEERTKIFHHYLKSCIYYASLSENHNHVYLTKKEKELISLYKEWYELIKIIEESKVKNKVLNIAPKEFIEAFKKMKFHDNLKKLAKIDEVLSTSIFTFSEKLKKKDTDQLIKFTYNSILKSVYNVGDSMPSSIFGNRRAYTLNKLDWSNLINLLYKPPPDVTL